MLINFIETGREMAVAVALRDLQEAVTRRETATRIAGISNRLVAAQRDALFVRETERNIAEVELESSQQAVEKAQAELVRALGGRAFDPATGDLI